MSPLRRWGRRLLYGAGGLLGTLLVVALIGLGVLQTSWGSTHTARFLAQWANPFEDASIHVGSAAGSWVTGLELRDVRLTQTTAGDSLQVARLDTVRVRYRLPALWNKRVHLRELVVSGPSVAIQQRADSSWTIPTLPPSESDTTASAWTIQMDQIDVRRGQLTAQFYAPEHDSTLQVPELTLQARNLVVADTLAARLDTLSLRAFAPGTSVPLDLRAHATLAGNRLSDARLTLDAPNSRVRSRGTLRWPDAPVPSLDDVNFTLTADPLDFQDLAPLAPALGLNPATVLHLNANVTGSGRHLQVRADGDLSTGGHFMLDATATPTFTAPDTTKLLYAGQARLRGLNTTFLASTDAPANHLLNADLQLDLSGPALDRLSGPLTAHLFDSRLSGYSVENIRLSAPFTNGQSRLDLQGQMADANIAISGTARPLAATPTYDLTTRLSNLDLGTLAPESGQTSNLAATARLRGRGLDPATALLTADLTVLPSILNRQAIESGELRVRLRDGSMDFTTALELPEGSLSAAGQASMSSALRYSLDRGRLDDLNVAALLGDTTSSALSGTIRGRGEGTDPATLSLTTNVSLRDSHYGPYVLNAATGRMALNSGQLETALRANLQGAQLTLSLTGHPFAEQPTYRSTEASFRAVDLGTLLQDSTQHTNLNGTASFSTTGLDPSSMQASATIQLDSSQVNLQPINSAQLQASLRNGTLDADLRWTTPEGTSRLAGTMRSMATTPSYALRTGTLEGVDLGALLGLPTARTDLNGTLALQGSGAELGAMTLNAQLDLASSAINQAAVNQGQIALQLDRSTGQLQGDLAFARGHIALQAHGQHLDANPQYQAEGRVSTLDAAALVGADTLDARVSLTASLEGGGLTPETAQFTGRLTADSSHYGAIRLDALDTHFQFADGLLRVDTLTARSNIARLSGSGPIAVLDTRNQHTSDFRVNAEIANLSPLQRIIGVPSLSLDEGYLEGRAYGAPGTLRFELTTAFTNLIYAGTRIGSFEGHLAGARGDTTLVSAIEARGTVDYIDTPTLTIERAEFSAQYDGMNVPFDVSVTLDRTRRLQVAGTTHPSDEEVTLRAVNIRLGPDRWQLLQDATLGYGDAYRVRNLLLYSEQQQLAADGVIDFDGEQSLIVTLEGFRMDAIAGLFGLGGLGGSLTGTLELSGSAEAPDFFGTLNLDISSEDTEVGELQLELDYSDLRMQTEALLTHVDGSTLTLTGGLPVDLRLNAPAVDTTEIDTQPVDLTLTADAFSIGWIDPFLDPTVARDATGQLTAQTSIGGTRSQPNLEGQATLRNGSIFLPIQGTTYNRINATLALQNTQVAVQEATMSSGGGTMRATGTVDLTELTLGTYDLALTANDFLVADTREYRANIDGDVTLRGTTRRPVLRGNVQMQSADFYLTSGSESDLATVQLTPRDEQILEQRFGVRLTEADTTTFDTYAALDMELTVEIERDTWLRSRANPEMNVQFTGSLDVSKAPFEPEQVFGTIEVVPERSRIVQFGRAFDITRGTLTFNGPAFEPILDLSASYMPRAPGTTQSSVEIMLSITGRPDELELTLSSNPPQMSTSDIFCYIAVARPCGQFGGGQSGGLDTQELAGRVAFSQAANLIENLAAANLGLDVIRIENRPTGTYLTAGQYLSPRFFASIEQALTTAADKPSTNVSVPNVTLEYELMRWLLIRAMYRNPDFRLNLFWEYAY